MKIIQITNEFSFGNGRAEVIKELSRYLSKNFDVEIWYQYSNQRGLPETNTKLIRLSGTFDLLRRLRRIKEKTIIVSNFGRYQPIIAIASSLNKNIVNIVIDYVNPPRMASNASWLANLKVEILCQFVYRFGNKKVVAISEYSRHLLIKKYGVSPDKIEKILLGIDSRKYSPKKLENHSKIRIGCFSRFGDSKNIDLLLNHIQDFKEKELWLAGARDSSSKKKAYERGVNLARTNKNLKIFTDLNEEEKLKFLNSLDIFVYPSLWEGFGLPILEAMSCGKPAIVFNRFAMPELVSSGSNGFVVNSEKEMTERINLLAKNKTLRIKMGRRAREFAEK
ncbi:Trehalose synthase [uncultured archaeon]|nr:Trehalose synthase [uncultured archaeon]